MSAVIKPLSNDELKDKAPSLFTEQPHSKVSDKYHFISTIDIVEQIREFGWYPVSVDESRVRAEGKNGYQQHCLRFQHFEDLLSPNGNVVELLLFNSHDRSKAFSISAGIYRYVCSNGLVISESVFDSYKIKHLGDKSNDLQNAISRVTEAKTGLLRKVFKFERINLSQEEKESFVKSAIPLRFDDHLQLNNKNDLLIPLREEDKKDDLYTTLNVLQENLLSSKISGYNKETGRKFTSKKINSIQKDVDINKGLWDIAERIAMIKDPAYVMNGCLGSVMKTTRYNFEKTVQEAKKSNSKYLKDEFRSILESNKDYTRKADYIGFSINSIDDKVSFIII